MRDENDANVGFLRALKKGKGDCYTASMANSRQRRPPKLSSIPSKLVRPDLERRGPLRLEKFLDLSGRKYERCSVIGLAGFIRGYAVWLCQCTCGTQFLTRRHKLQAEPVGCGCARRGFNRHPDSQSVEYRTWKRIMLRNGREVCARWHRYDNFLSDVGRKPGPKYMLVHLDKALPYDQGNVRWLPTAEASIRRRSNFISHGGRTLNISGWARLLGISHQAMNKRIQRCKAYGAPLSEALTTAPGEFMPTAYERFKHPKEAIRANGQSP